VYIYWIGQLHGAQWNQLTIDLSHCNIRDTGFHHLSKAISKLNCEIKSDTINLSDNQL